MLRDQHATPATFLRVDEERRAAGVFDPGEIWEFRLSIEALRDEQVMTVAGTAVHVRLRDEVTFQVTDAETTRYFGADPQLTLPDPALTEDEHAVLRLLGPQPRSADDLIAESSLPTARVTAALTLLEMKSLARKCAATSYVRVFGRVTRER